MVLYSAVRNRVYRAQIGGIAQGGLTRTMCHILSQYVRDLSFFPWTSWRAIGPLRSYGRRCNELTNCQESIKRERQKKTGQEEHTKSLATLKTLGRNQATRSKWKMEPEKNETCKSICGFGNKQIDLWLRLLDASRHFGCCLVCSLRLLLGVVRSKSKSSQIKVFQFPASVSILFVSLLCFFFDFNFLVSVSALFEWKCVRKQEKHCSMKRNLKTHAGNGLSRLAAFFFSPGWFLSWVSPPFLDPSSLFPFDLLCCFQFSFFWSSRILIRSTRSTCKQINQYSSIRSAPGCLERSIHEMISQQNAGADSDSSILLSLVVLSDCYSYRLPRLIAFCRPCQKHASLWHQFLTMSLLRGAV